LTGHTTASKFYNGANKTQVNDKLVTYTTGGGLGRKDGQRGKSVDQGSAKQRKADRYSTTSRADVLSSAFKDTFDNRKVGVDAKKAFNSTTSVRRTQNPFSRD